MCLIKTLRTPKMSDLRRGCGAAFQQDFGMFSLLRHLIGWIISSLGSRQDLILENLALRQQLLSMHATYARIYLLLLRRLDPFCATAPNAWLREPYMLRLLGPWLSWVSARFEI